MKIVCSFLVLMVAASGFAQNGGGDTRAVFKYHIKKTVAPVKLDAVIGENEWDNHELITNFFNHWPNDQGRAQNQTEVKNDL